MTAVAGEEEERGLWIGGHKSLASRPTLLPPLPPFPQAKWPSPFLIVLKNQEGIQRGS